MDDLHRLIARIKKEKKNGFTEDELIINVLENFVKDNEYNAVTINPNKSGVIDAISITTKNMKILFKNFHEIVLMDSTHKTNKNNYKLLSFMVHDSNGNGQHVQHSFISKESTGNFQNAITHFQKSNKDWRNIRAFVVDKDFTEIAVIEKVC